MIGENFNCDKKLAHLNEQQPILEAPRKDKKDAKKPRNSKIKSLDFYASYVSKNVEIQKKFDETYRLCEQKQQELNNLLKELENLRKQL
ncbi:hypothetical protein [Helicobacter pylori]|uniref:hypothetical protein n=1 Tax=Helicobacter pylori TaxID=210 RepID=UPI000573D035|nr:hypothetical protein [Helicobacter pylori]AUO31529.1 Hypothetical protein [Helicobacter pylori]KHL90171.1 hypothetical protein HPY499_04985 [Helicobacter pylori]MBH0264846.1 hypothetical protein [Helicobacter pylori]MBH0266374.1 hypothetical protein [Helicobacter pylori]